MTRLDLRSVCLAALAGAWLGCASEVETAAECGVRLIRHSLMYTAFDGVHAYSVTPDVPSAVDNSQDSDPLVAQTLRWQFDPAFFTASAFPEIGGAIKLTTKKAGETEIRMYGTTTSGVTMRDTAKVIIAQAEPNVWSMGDARYQEGVTASWGNFAPTQQGWGTCGLPYAIEIPRAAACVSCHDNSDQLSAEYTPTQTAGYSDADLLNIVLTGSKPPGGTFISPHLSAMPMPDCIFAEFHAFEMTELEQRGLIARLRSVPPRVIE